MLLKNCDTKSCILWKNILWSHRTQCSALGSTSTNIKQTTNVEISLRLNLVPFLIYSCFQACCLLTQNTRTTKRNWTGFSPCCLAEEAGTFLSLTGAAMSCCLSGLEYCVLPSGTDYRYCLREISKQHPCHKNPVKYDFMENTWLFEVKIFMDALFFIPLLHTYPHTYSCNI